MVTGKVGSRNLLRNAEAIARLLGERRVKVVARKGLATPELVQAIDGTQIATVRDGKVWLFAIAEHWNAEALGWHVSKRGTRHEALQAMSMAVRQQFGSLGRDAARGGQLRHDHGSCFMARISRTRSRHGA